MNAGQPFDMDRPTRCTARVSVILSLSLMTIGLFGALWHRSSQSALIVPFGMTFADPFRFVMAAGILILALFPGVRVAIALVSFKRGGSVAKAVVAAVVLAELLISMLASGS